MPTKAHFIPRREPVTNPFRDQEKFMRACDQTVEDRNDAQFKLYYDLIAEIGRAHV